MFRRVPIGDRCDKRLNLGHDDYVIARSEGVQERTNQETRVSIF